MALLAMLLLLLLLLLLEPVPCCCLLFPVPVISHLDLTSFIPKRSRCSWICSESNSSDHAQSSSSAISPRVLARVPFPFHPVPPSPSPPVASASASASATSSSVWFISAALRVVLLLQCSVLRRLRAKEVRSAREPLFLFCVALCFESVFISGSA